MCGSWRSTIDDVLKTAADWKWQSDLPQFWRSLADVRSPERLQTERQMSYLHARSLGFLAAALKGSRHVELEEFVSKSLLKLSRISYWEDQTPADEFVALPSTEALANQLLMLAELDQRVFVALLPLPWSYPWPQEVLAQGLREHLATEPRLALPRYLQTARAILGEPFDGGEEAESPISARTSLRIRSEATIMLETLDAFVAEVLQTAGNAAALSPVRGR